MRPTRILSSSSRDTSPNNGVAAVKNINGDGSSLKLSEQKQNMSVPLSGSDNADQEVPKYGVTSTTRNPLENVKLRNYIPKKSAEERIPKEVEKDPRYCTHPEYRI